MRHLLALLLIAGCYTDSDEACPYPDEAVAPGGTLDNTDDCGHWLVGIDEHLILSLSVIDAGTACDAVLDQPLGLASDPIFSDFGDEGPKFTFDITPTAQAVGDGIAIQCEDGTAWLGRVSTP